MPNLPIVIIGESHIDYRLHFAYRSLFHKLQTLGYNTLCREFPSSMQADTFVKLLQENIDVNKSNLSTCLKMINAHVQQPFSENTLLRLNLHELSNLIRQFVDTKNFYQIAAELLSLTPNKFLVENLKKFKDKLQLVGVDIEQEFDPLRGLHLLTQREKHMAAQIAKLHAAGKKIIFTVGKLHIPGLCLELEKLKLLPHTVCFNFSTHMTLEPEYTDAELASLERYKSYIHAINLEDASTVDDAWDSMKKFILPPEKMLYAYQPMKATPIIGLAGLVMPKLPFV